MSQSRPRLWLRLKETVAQKPPDSYRGVTHRAREWVEIRGYVRRPGEENPYSAPETQWSFWGSHDIDLSPIFSEDQVESVYVEPGHPYAAVLRDAADTEAGFSVTVAEAPPAGETGS